MVNFCKICGETKECAKGRFRCLECYTKIEKERYHKNKDRHREKRKEYAKENSERLNKKSKDWYENNKEKAQERIMTRYYDKSKEINTKIACKKYGLTEKQYEEMKERTKGKCEICGQMEEKMCIDHDHINGKVRGYLCNNCNSGLGFLKDNFSTVNKAANYLKNRDFSKSSVEFYGGFGRSILT